MERVAVFGDAGTGKSTLVMRLRGWLETVDQAQLQVWARFVFGDRRPKMKHATAEDLIPIAGLLDKIRREKRIKERNSGIFYWRGKAFLHFHEDPRGLFADLRGPDDWERLAVNDRRGQALLLAKMSQLLSNPS